MGGEHGHGAGASERALWLAFVPTTLFMVVEFAGGWLSDSLALISDAGHMATDVLGLGMAIAAVRLGRRPADARRSFGYGRFEILAAAINAGLLLAVGIYILVEAWHRLTAPPEVHSVAMVVIALLGLAVNVFSMVVLAGGKAGSLNVKGAYLEVLSDFVGSIGVLLAGIAIYFTGLAWIDSVVAIAVGLWVFPRVWVLLSDTVNVLLEGVPHEIDLRAVRAALLAVPGVESVHDLHVWSLTSGQVCLMAHVVAPGRAEDADALHAEIRQGMERGFGIEHVTIQCERVPCEERERLHDFL